MLNEFLNLPIDRLDMNQLISNLAFGRTLVRTFEDEGVEVPANIADRVKLLARQVRDKNEDALRAQLRQNENKLHGMKPEAQKRRELQAQNAALRAKLGI
jgi:hypothetical protein